MSGILIAFEGIDGSGKGTQSKLLFDRLRDAGVAAELLSFPRYAHTRFGRFIGDYLNGKFGTLASVDPLLASLLFAGDRFESRDLLSAALERSRVVICDRYVASNLAHQAAKRRGEARVELMGRIQAIEYDAYSLPRAAKTVLLDLSVPNAQRLIETKAKRSYTDRSADLHEADARYLTAVREVYRSCGESDPNWIVVACDDADRIRPVAEIHEEIWCRLGLAETTS